MTESALQYRSYLLRVWQSEQQGQVRLRLLLEDVRTGERFSFADPADMAAFLQEPADQWSPAGAQPTESGLAAG